ncbi:hypothetical protein BDQ17DRAFT_118186 [Cyathus striatus]|nr:hypothetical protein BDQ17DRAFT_118186 [Cyathus striatus]
MLSSLRAIPFFVWFQRKLSYVYLFSTLWSMLNSGDVQIFILKLLMYPFTGLHGKLMNRCVEYFYQGTLNLAALLSSPPPLRLKTQATNTLFPHAL